MELKEEILVKSEELFLRYGIKSITMDDIAKELGISKKTLYQYVDNKSDLIKKTIVLFIDNEKLELASIKKESNNPIEEMLNIARHVTNMLRRVGPNTVYDLKKYYRESWHLLESFHHQHIYQVIKENINEGVKKGQYRNDMDADVIAKLYVWMSFHIVDDQLFPLQDYNREKLFWEFIRYHIHGIASSNGLNLLEQFRSQRTNNS